VEHVGGDLRITPVERMARAATTMDKSEVGRNPQWSGA
jgi:hypothetical protein